jgi:hypothetical protein
MHDLAGITGSTASSSIRPFKLPHEAVVSVNCSTRLSRAFPYLPSPEAHRRYARDPRAIRRNRRATVCLGAKPVRRFSAILPDGRMATTTQDGARGGCYPTMMRGGRAA